MLASMLDPESSFPPNARQIALQSDSFKRSITEGVCSIEGAEMIIEAAAELTSVTAFYNRHSEITWEDEHGPDEEDNNHDSAQRLND